MRDICIDTAEIEMAILRDPKTDEAPVETPVDMPAEEFRRHGYAVIDRLVDFYSRVNDLPVFPTILPTELVPLFDGPAPEAGEPLEAILADWEQKIVPNSTIQGSPRFLSWVNGGGTQVGALAEALAAGLNPNPGGWRASQAAVVIENQTIRWIADLMGLAPTAGGLFVSGGTMANVAGLQMALRKTATWDIQAEGIQSPNRPGRLTVYMADHEAHVSFKRAVDSLGLGRDAIRGVPSNADFTIDTAALERMLAEDRANGMTPFAIVGHAGSINAGAIDDLDALATIARREQLWFHVDGAIGALGAILPELRHRYRGIERADSVSFDAHKWLGVPYECGCVLVRDAAVLKRSFAISASYLTEDERDELEAFDFFNRGPQMSRGFRAMKVWMSLRYYGAEGYRQFFRRTIANARYAHALVSAAADFEVLQPEPELYIYSFRYNPGGLTEAELDDLNARIADEVKARQVALVMISRVHGKVVQRFACTNHRTTTADIDAVIEAMREIGRELTQ
jgi:glutamate/tyrosine decarboxylase-like PLP-dependent enzyme